MSNLGPRISVAKPLSSSLLLLNSTPIPSIQSRKRPYQHRTTNFAGKSQPPPSKVFPSTAAAAAAAVAAKIESSDEEEEEEEEYVEESSSSSSSTIQQQQWPSSTDIVMNPIIHPCVKCTNCQVYPIIGQRYRCISCADVELCGVCVQSSIHWQEHQVVHVPTATFEYEHEIASLQSELPASWKFIYSSLLHSMYRERLASLHLTSLCRTCMDKGNTSDSCDCGFTEYVDGSNAKAALLEHLRQDHHKIHVERRIEMRLGNIAFPTVCFSELVIPTLDSPILQPQSWNNNQPEPFSLYGYAI